MNDQLLTKLEELLRSADRITPGMDPTDLYALKLEILELAAKCIALCKPEEKEPAAGGAPPEDGTGPSAVSPPSSEDAATVPGAWRPISTAPRHYKPILLMQDDAIGEGCYATHIRCWEFFNPDYMMRRNPTHWMPKPDPTHNPVPEAGAPAREEISEEERRFIRDLCRDVWLASYDNKDRSPESGAAELEQRDMEAAVLSYIKLRSSSVRAAGYATCYVEEVEPLQKKFMRYAHHDAVCPAGKLERDRGACSCGLQEELDKIERP